ncbi:caspase family protein [Dyadobacter sp. CY261]|uniref:caspase family protein n=1 Tax=Dyadobacter sp. CY261 TaxID=2907203 RepID=UPI001F34ACDF|nr:caspase family protein [Dyadobacter sp. CY261]MCF0070814.1 caspase family protein [Dyadobacter sp. CY261]
MLGTIRLMKYGPLLVLLMATCVQAQNDGIRWKVPNEEENQYTIYTRRPSYTIEFEITWTKPRTSSEPAHIKLVRNGKPYDSGSKELDEVELADIPKAATKFSKTVSLLEGENVWEAEAHIGPGIILRSKSVRIIRKVGKPDLYLLCVGVPYNLKYTEQDAKALAAGFKTQQGHLFGKVTGKVLICAENTRLSKLGQTFSDLKRQQLTEDDVLLIFISSHGKAGKVDGSSDFGVVSNDAAFGVSDPKYVLFFYQKDIIANIDKLPCKRIVLLDACHSGGANGNKSWVGTLAGAQTAISQTPSGIVTIASSNADEASWEHEKWKHGAFTYAILEGLLGNADKPDAKGYSDSTIMLSELADYVSKRVPTLVQDAWEQPQHPYIMQAAGQDYPIFNYRQKGKEEDFPAEACKTPLTPLHSQKLAILGILPEKSIMDWFAAEKTANALKKVFPDYDIAPGEASLVNNGTAIAILDGYPPSGKKTDYGTGTNLLCIVSRQPTSYTKINAKTWQAKLSAKFTFFSPQTNKIVYEHTMEGEGTAGTEQGSEKSALNHAFQQLSKIDAKLLQR